MLLPVGRVDGCVGNRVAAVNHHAVADINANVTCTRGVIGFLEENQVAGPCITRPDDFAVVSESFGGRSPHIPAVAAVVNDIADKAGAVKAGRWGRAAPDIRIAEIFLCFTDHVGKALVGQRLAGNIVFQIVTACRNIGIVGKEIVFVALGLQQNGIALGLILVHAAGLGDDMPEIFVHERDIENFPLSGYYLLDFQLILQIKERLQGGLHLASAVILEQNRQIGGQLIGVMTDLIEVVVILIVSGTGRFDVVDFFLKSSFERLVVIVCADNISLPNF